MIIIKTNNKINVGGWLNTIPKRPANEKNKKKLKNKLFCWFLILFIHMDTNRIIDKEACIAKYSGSAVLWYKLDNWYGVIKNNMENNIDRILSNFLFSNL